MRAINTVDLEALAGQLDRDGVKGHEDELRDGRCLCSPRRCHAVPRRPGQLGERGRDRPAARFRQGGRHARHVAGHNARRSRRLTQPSPNSSAGDARTMGGVTGMLGFGLRVAEWADVTY